MDISTHNEYKLFDYSDLSGAIVHIKQYAKTVKRAGRGTNSEYNDLIIGADTETSKVFADKYETVKHKSTKQKKKWEELKYIPQENIIVAWTISVRNANGNICTIYGHKPSELVRSIKYIHTSLDGEKTLIFWHNMAYDFWFIDRFCLKEYGKPVTQLNTKPHYPVQIEYENGIVFRDSLIIAQKSLERWANELEVEHKKSVGKWDYEKRRTQNESFSDAEIEYIEHDTLALVECLDVLRDRLHKHVYSIPLTCTGIIREVVRNEGRRHNAKNRFERIAPTYELYNKLVQSYHGGYVHNNRSTAGFVWPEPGCSDLPTAYDFCSSYPYVCLTEPMPGERFRRIPDVHMHRKEILKYSDVNAYLFTLRGYGVILKDMNTPMPVLQLSKCTKYKDVYTDNGRIMAAEYIEIVLNEIDLALIDAQYKFVKHECVDVWISSKRPLPRWYRDIVYKCFEDKTRLKGGDVVEYALAKARLRQKLNSLYGMMAQKSCREDIVENFDTFEYEVKYWKNEDDEKTFKEASAEEQQKIIEDWNVEQYGKYLSNINNILPFYWGCWVTSAAMRNLFSLSKCIKTDGVWLYSDTDSIYAMGWDTAKVEKYNEGVKNKMKNAGYGPVIHNGREYWPGIAELDGVYAEFIGLHSKCYAVRKTEKVGDVYEPRDVKITVAGVPKKGCACLNDDLSNFADGFVFPGKDTGKLTHFYINRGDIYISEDGTEFGNSIDLHECDYVISEPKISDILDLLTKHDVNVQVYEDE